MAGKMPITDPYPDIPRARRLPALAAFVPGPGRHSEHFLRPLILQPRRRSLPLAILLHSPNQPSGGWIIPASPQTVCPDALAAPRCETLPSRRPGPSSALASSLVMSSFLQQRTSWKLRFSAPIFSSEPSSWRRPSASSACFCWACWQFTTDLRLHTGPSYRLLGLHRLQSTLLDGGVGGGRSEPMDERLGGFRML